MKDVLIKYDTESVRWMGYHTALKGFFDSVAGLPNIPGNDDKFGKNVKVIYATPSSAFTKYVIPMVNGLAQYPIISFYLSGERVVDELPGSPFAIHSHYMTDADGNLQKVSFSRPLVKELTYRCDIYATKMSDCDYLLTLLECNSNKWKPFSCKVNGRPAQFYIDDVETGTPVEYEGKKFISSSFNVRVPMASILPAEIETDVDVIRKINAYLSGEEINISEPAN